jgi:hypothetical protein
MKSLTVNSEWRPQRADDTGLTVFLKRRGSGYEITRNPTDPAREVYPDAYTGHTRPTTYAAFTGAGVVIVLPDPEPEIIWEAAFTIPAGTSDYVIENRNFRNLDPTKALWVLPNNGRKVIFRNCVMESAGSTFTGFRYKLEVEDCHLTVLPQTQAGRPMARLVNGEEIKHLIFRNNTVPSGGRGIYMSGVNNATGQKVWAGSYAAGDRLIVERNRCEGLNGQYSDGQGGYIRSNWGTTHSDAAVTPAGVRGWTTANFVQLNGIPECAYYIGYNIVLAPLKRSRTEDVISAFGGSGGTADLPAVVEHNLIVTSGGLDWNYVAGESAFYNGSNQISLNATGYQNISSTRYSGTGQIIGDGVRHDLWEYNANYTISRNNVILGPRAYLTTQGGAYASMIDNEIYQLDKHPDGTPYTGYVEALYQWSEYEVNASAPSRNGETTVIWGHHTMTGNSLYRTGVGSVTALNTGSAVLKNGGTASNNFLRPGPTDGGAARIAAWEAAQTAAGRVIGRRT